MLEQERGERSKHAGLRFEHAARQEASSTIRRLEDEVAIEAAEHHLQAWRRALGRLPSQVS